MQPVVSNGSTQKKKNQEMILVDFNNTAISSIMTQVSTGEKIDVNFVRHIILNGLLAYRKKFKQEYGELVLCVDNQGNWRRDIFPYYKARRKMKRESDSADEGVYAQVSPIFDQIKHEVAENLPYKYVTLPRAEGDDVIAVLAENLEGPHMIVSNDKDFQQLQRIPNVLQYRPLNNKVVKNADPIRFLREQIICGDAGDDVPNILSDDDAFVNPDKRQKSIFKKKLKSWLEQEYSEFAEEDKIERNRKCIDLSEVPEDLADDIMKIYNEFVPNSRQKLLPYFMENRLKGFMDQIQNF